MDQSQNGAARRESRRGFLGSSTLLAGGAAAALHAQSPAPTEVEILNYALGLEHLEAAFYTQGLAKFQASDFAGSSLLAPLGSAITTDVYDLFRTIRDHEVAHVTGLQAAVRTAGGTPVTACTYDFKVITVEDMIRTARVLENTGVQAYIGVMNLLKTPEIITAGAGILAVEARHAAYLNLLNDASPFPSTVDQGRSMAQIQDSVKGYITSCATTAPPAPQTVAVLGPKNLTTVQPEIVLDATASSAADKGPLRYQVRVAPGGKSASIIGGDTATPRVQFNEGIGNYVFELTVTDAKGATAKDTATITYIGR